jgi:hypothetical protein
MQATYCTRNVYGETKVYPVNAAAKAVARIAGTRTLRKSDMIAAQEGLGVEWEHVPDPDHAPVSDFLAL